MSLACRKDKIKRFLLVIPFGCFPLFSIFCQTPLADFSLLTNGCVNQNIILTNQSTNATAYEWDLCQGDLILTPTATNIQNLGGSVTTGIDIVFDGTNWFGFVTSQGTNSILRLDYGSDLYNTPTVLSLGNIGNLTNSPTDIKVVYDNGNWYGFVYGLSDPLISRINFGSSLTNTQSSSTPITSDVLLHGSGSVNGGFDISRDGTNWTIVLTLNSSFSIVRLATISSIPGAPDILQGMANPYGSALGDIVLRKSNGNFFGYVVAYGNKTLQRLSFGSTLFTTPTIDNVVLSILSSSTPYGIDIAFDNGIFYLIVSTLEGTLLKISLGSDLSVMNATATSYPAIVLENNLKIRIVNTKSNWIAFSPSWSSLRLYRVSFPNPSSCPTGASFSTAINPILKYSSSGDQYITLRSFNGGSIDERSKSISIGASTSPDIDFTSQNNCINNPVNFNPQSTSANIASYSWDFGDGNVSSATQPTHTYISADSFNVSLQVTASNGCVNAVSHSKNINNPPQASFSLPTVSPICSNQSYTLTNTSTFDIGTTPAWQWSVNGTNVSTNKNLDYTIASTSAISIALTASIPGCSTQATNSISTIVGGPKVDFTSASTGCVGSSIKFTNATTGSATSYAWDFGDSNTSSLTTTASVTNSYASAGPYAVKLTVSNAAGCQNFVSRNISIYSNPQPAFAIEAPPFSCANYPAQFDNNTSPPTDSNIVSWLWAFGDTDNGSSSQKNPSYTFTAEGSYNVSLTATTNFGCATTLQNPITIGASPTANFKTSPACVNQGTQFIDLSTGSITSYEWAVQNSVLSGASPSPYTFKSAGSFPLTLSVTASSGCKNQVTKTVVVPVMPVMDFTVTAPCTRNPTILRELNAGGADPAVAWNWSFNGVNGGTGSPFSYTFPIVGGYSVTLTSTRQSGCVYTASKNVIINSGPIAAFTPSAQAGAAPLTVSFENNSIADTYLWSFGDADNTTSTSVSPIFTYTKLGKYKASLTANNSYGCSDTLSSEINVVIPQADLAMQSFSLVNDPTSGSSRAVVTVSNIGNIPLTNPEIKIDLAGGAIVKENIQGTVAPGKSVTSTLSLEIIPRSIDYICAIVSATSDIDPSNNEKCVSITNSDYLFSPYPNPASGNINMDWISASSEEVKVSIYKTTGELAFQQQFSNVTPGLVQLSISTTTLSNGLYLIRFEGAKEQKTFRVMVAN